jgi:hypothetical protein
LHAHHFSCAEESGDFVVIVGVDVESSCGCVGIKTREFVPRNIAADCDLIRRIDFTDVVAVDLHTVDKNNQRIVDSVRAVDVHVCDVVNKFLCQGEFLLEKRPSVGIVPSLVGSRTCGNNVSGCRQVVFLTV